MIDDVLFKVLSLDGNETGFLKNKDSYFLYNLLVKELIKIKIDMRYCYRRDCPCQPESSIVSLLEDKELYEFLEVYGEENLVLDLKNLVLEFNPLAFKKELLN